VQQSWLTLLIQPIRDINDSNFLKSPKYLRFAIKPTSLIIDLSSPHCKLLKTSRKTTKVENHCSGIAPPIFPDQLKVGRLVAQKGLGIPTSTSDSPTFINIKKQESSS
jgi:hypothetical protein